MNNIVEKCRILPGSETVAMIFKLIRLVFDHPEERVSGLYITERTGIEDDYEAILFFTKSNGMKRKEEIVIPRLLFSEMD